MERLLFDIYTSGKSLSHCLKHAPPQLQKQATAISTLPSVYAKFTLGRLLSSLQMCEIVNEVDLTVVGPLREQVLMQLQQFGVGQAEGIAIWLVFNRLMSRLWNGARILIQERVEQLRKKTDQNLFINKFVITVLIKQLGHQLQNALEEYLHLHFFSSIDPYFTPLLVSFIIENHQLFRMKFHQIQQTKDPLEFIKDLRAIYEVALAESLKPWESRVQMYFQCELHLLRSVRVKNRDDVGFVLQHPENQLELLVHCFNQKSRRGVITNVKYLSQQYRQFVVVSEGKTASCCLPGTSYYQDRYQQQIAPTKLEGAQIQEESQTLDFYQYDWEKSLLQKNKTELKQILAQGQRVEEGEKSLGSFGEGNFTNVLKTNIVSKQKIDGQIRFMSSGNVLIVHQFQITGPKIFVGVAGGIGSSLGYCLSNILKYDSPRKFLRDFGTMAAIDGTLSYLMMRVPIFGNFLILGGLGYRASLIWKKTHLTKKKRLKKLGRFFFETGGLIGFGILGAVLGHLAIPVPFLGAFVGGVIGGMFAGTSIQTIIKKIEGKSFTKKVGLLEQRIQEDGSVEALPQTAAIVGATTKHFLDTFPEYLRKRNKTDLVIRHRMWMTTLVYAILSLYYSKEQLLKQKEVYRKYRSFRILKKKVKPEDQEAYDREMAEAQELVPESMQKLEGYLLRHNIRVLEMLDNVYNFISALNAK